MSEDKSPAPIANDDVGITDTERAQLVKLNNKLLARAEAALTQLELQMRLTDWEPLEAMLLWLAVTQVAMRRAEAADRARGK